MKRRYIIEDNASIKDKITKFAMSDSPKKKDFTVELAEFMSEKQAYNAYMTYCNQNNLDPILDADDPSIKERLIDFIKKDVFLTEDILPVLIEKCSPDLLEYVFEDYENIVESTVITEGKLGRALGMAAIAASSLFAGNAHANDFNNTDEKVSSEVLPSNMQKELGIRHVTLDAKTVVQLAEDIKSKIKTDWEDYGYDNTRITETDGWNWAVTIRDTLQDAAPELGRLFTKTVNQEMFYQLKVTPRL